MTELAEAKAAMDAALDDLKAAMVADLSRLEPSFWPWWIRRHFRKDQRRRRQERALGVRP